MFGVCKLGMGTLLGLLGSPQVVPWDGGMLGAGALFKRPQLGCAAVFWVGARVVSPRRGKAFYVVF